MKNIVTIWIKELKDTIRDRRTVIAMIVMPMVILPITLVNTIPDLKPMLWFFAIPAVNAVLVFKS